MDPTRRGRKRKLSEIEQEGSPTEASSSQNVSEPESKRVAFKNEEPEPTPRMDPTENESTLIEKNSTSPKPRTPPCTFLFAEEPSPEPTRAMLDLNVSDPSATSYISSTVVSSDEEFIQIATEMADVQPMRTTTEIDEEQPMQTSTELDEEQPMQTSTE
ncbi:hypothetical protein NPIL_351311, partial [Nephila pilipes]